MVDAQGALRPDYLELAEALGGWSLEEYEQRKARADLALLSAGITFNVYSDEEGTERIFPFSLIPRIVGAEEWRGVDAGLKQRLTALNLFLLDIYGEQRVLKEKVVPEEIVLSSPGYRSEMVGFRAAAGGVRAHCGVRPGTGRKRRLRRAGGQPADAVGRLGTCWRTGR